MLLKQLISGLEGAFGVRTLWPGDASMFGVGQLDAGKANAVQAGPGRLDDPMATRICDLTEDSRTVLPGSLFVARSGTKSDGRRFVADARASGAVAILIDSNDDARARAAVEAARSNTSGSSPAIVLGAADLSGAVARIADRFYGEPSKKLRAIGVTGTNGKTTTTWLAWKILNSCGIRSGLVGTVVVDDGREVAPASMTTLPAIELSRSMASMVEAGCRAVVMETSSHALHQKRVDGVSFDAGVFTNLTGDHLDYHGSMEAYADAKARLFSLVKPDGVAIVNGQDVASSRMLRDCTARMLACHQASEEPAAMFGAERAGERATARVLAWSLRGMELALDGPWGIVTTKVPFVGAYNVMNTLQAVAASHALGLTRDQIAEGLGRVTPPPGRLEPCSRAEDDVLVFVDYAHTDDAMRNVLGAVRAAMNDAAQGAANLYGSGDSESPGRPGRLWIVFGCGGDRDKSKRPRMGRAASELADRVVVTSDNPRTEKPSDIIAEILAGVPADLRNKAIVQADRARAIAYAISGAAPGDVVVVAGKGHETEQILPDARGGTLRQTFDDRVVAKQELAARRAARPAT
ncbi:MAG: UDP-N-acetylmuramoyl-L-alanyl-D-glutamate--2,6-diaminopimelate ligase [Planctomycetota bacterium]|nr:UDP-N-acetylmuramoyl-L-alanyl-D-glutamate--2,6-diaminopimelate ligase [Planctomycetota bacterium]